MTFHSDAHYIEPISIRDARNFLIAYFGKARIPHGSTCYWIAGIHEVTDTPGVYLVAGAGGMCGVMVLPNVAAERRVG